VDIAPNILVQPLIKGRDFQQVKQKKSWEQAMMFQNIMNI